MSGSSKSLLLQTIPVQLSSSLDNFSVPSIDHCAGTGKLLGEFYGKALCEGFCIEDLKVRKILSELSVLMRAFIVLDDYIKDHISKNPAKEVIEKWLLNIKAEAISLIEDLGDDGEILWDRYFALYEDSYYNYFKRNAYKSTLMKCSFLFLPFDLSICRKYECQSTKMKKAVGYYLFSLQLLDDFHDMEEDLISPKNHNLFTSSLSSEYQRKLLSGKSCLVKSLMSYIESNLRTVINGSLGSKIFDKYLCRGIEWLSSVSLSFLNYPSIDVFKGDYCDYMLTNDKIRPFSLVLETANPVDVTLICAEAMHTTYYNEERDG